MTGENELPKVSKTEEKESFLKRLEERNAVAEELHAKIQQERERLEELQARQILGGKVDAGVQPEPVKAETPKDYINKILKGEIQLTRE